MKADEPPGVDALELITDEAFDIHFQSLSPACALLVVLISFEFLLFLLTQRH